MKKSKKLKLRCQVVKSIQIYKSYLKFSRNLMSQVKIYQYIFI